VLYFVRNIKLKDNFLFYYCVYLEIEWDVSSSSSFSSSTSTESSESSNESSTHQSLQAPPPMNAKRREMKRKTFRQMVDSLLTDAEKGKLKKVLTKYSENR